MPDEQPAPNALTAAEFEKVRKDAKRKLWAAGVLSWKFKERKTQKRAYDFIRANWGRSPFLALCCHRRWGKSTVSLCIGLEECIRRPHTRVAIVCKTKDQARAICEESMIEILADCPRELQPRRIKNDFAYVFDGNGSSIVFLAADAMNAQRARGRKFAVVIIDEAAFIDGLDGIVSSIFAPTLRDVLGNTTGTMIMLSTPPEIPNHPFEHMFAAAELDGRAFFLPLSKNPDAAQRFVEECERDCGGRDTITFQREYECRFVVDSASTAVPEFTPERAFTGDPEKGVLPIVRDLARPAASDRYVSMDVGGRDLTALLWGFYHFEQDRVVIENELAILNVTSDELAARVAARDRETWGTNPDGRVLRVSDNTNVILLYDLQRKHGLRFQVTAKDNKDAQLNALRVMIRDGKLVIHTRCRLLIKTLRLARRAKQSYKGFERDGEIGHADLLDALLYLVRNVRRHAIPEAPIVRHVEQDLPKAPEKPLTAAASALKRALRLR